MRIWNIYWFLFQISFIQKFASDLSSSFFLNLISLALMHFLKGITIAFQRCIIWNTFNLLFLIESKIMKCEILRMTEIWPYLTVIDLRVTLSQCDTITPQYPWSRVVDHHVISQHYQHVISLQLNWYKV